MASYGFVGPVTATDERELRLSAEERDFLDFLLYQYGDVWVDEADGPGWSEWASELGAKLRKR